MEKFLRLRTDDRKNDYFEIEIQKKLNACAKQRSAFLPIQISISPVPDNLRQKYQQS